MTSVFRVVKVFMFVTVMYVLTDLVIASYNIPPMVYPSFGTSLSAQVAMLVISYTRIGKRYFTNYFRATAILLMIPLLVEQIDLFAGFVNTAQYFNITLAFGLLAFVSSLASLIIKK